MSLAELKGVAEDIRQQPCCAFPTSTRSTSSARGRRTHLHRVQPRQARHPRHHPAADLRQRRPPERRGLRRIGRDLGRPHRPARHRRLLGRRGHRRRAGRGRRAQCSASATSPRSSAATRTRRPSSSAKAASRRSGSASRWQDGANIITLGENLEAGDEVPSPPSCRSASTSPRSPTSRTSSTSRCRNSSRVFVEALVIVLVVSFLSLGLRTGIVVALSVPLVLAIVFVVMYARRARPAPHHPRRADHRPRAARRRRDHRHRDDGGEDGAGLGSRASGDLRLDLDRLPDADRHAGHRRGLPAGRLRQVELRRICRRHLLGGRPRADRLLDRRGGVHALSRPEAPAGFRQAARAPHTIPRRSTTPASIAPCAA